jgi:hypothetical protein
MNIGLDIATNIHRLTDEHIGITNEFTVSYRSPSFFPRARCVTTHFTSQKKSKTAPPPPPSVLCVATTTLYAVAQSSVPPSPCAARLALTPGPYARHRLRLMPAPAPPAWSSPSLARRRPIATDRPGLSVLCFIRPALTPPTPRCPHRRRPSTGAARSAPASLARGSTGRPWPESITGPRP